MESPASGTNRGGVTVQTKQRAPCHRDYSIFLWIMPQRCAHVEGRALTPTRPASAKKKL